MLDLLVVTDQPVLPAWGRGLELDGHCLRTVSTREELLDQLACSSFAGVLVEHHEWASGLLAGAPVRELGPRTRVLVIADPVTLSSRTDLEALGIHDLVFGPVDLTALRRRVRRRFASGTPPLAV